MEPNRNDSSKSNNPDGKKPRIRIFTMLLIAIAVVINVLVSALPLEVTQIDTTSAGLFSLSEETEIVVQALEDDITVYWVVQSG